MSTPPRATALVLFAHGARNPDWARPLHTLQERVLQRAPRLTVRLAFLELLQPGLDTVLDELAPQHDLVDLLPVFWAPTGHVSRELPLLLAAAAQRHPGLQVRVLPTLSELPGLLDSVAAAATGGFIPPDQAP